MLNGIKIVELEGYLPTSFFGKILADLGADSYVIKFTDANPLIEFSDFLHDNKKRIPLNLKDKTHIKILKQILKESDVFIDGNRPGVLEKLGLDPVDLLKLNPRLIVARMTGYGKEGKFHLEPGHEINYLGLSGFTHFFRTKDNHIMYPNLISGDILCGSLMPAFHVTQAILNRELNGGKGCIIDTCITTNAASAIHLSSKFIQNDDFYFTVATKNEKYLLFCIHKSNKESTKANIIETLNFIKKELINYLQLNLVQDLDSNGKNSEKKEELIEDIQSMALKIDNESIIDMFYNDDRLKVLYAFKHDELYERLDKLNLTDENGNIKHPFEINISNECDIDTKNFKSKKLVGSDLLINFISSFNVEKEDINYLLKSLAKPKF